MRELTRPAASTYNNSQLRSTCVPTLLQGGHAENALPQMARATINCRLLPDEDPDHVDAMLTNAVADAGIEIRRVAPPQPSPPSPVNTVLFAQIASVA